MGYFKLALTAALITVPAFPAQARDPVLIHAMQIGQESVRYYKGKPTLDLEQQLGAVQVSPFTIDKGSLVFTVAVFNRAGAPINVGIENVTAMVDGVPHKVMTVEELVKKERDRARWQQIGLAFLGGLAAYSATRPSTYHSTYRSSWGASTYTAKWSNPYAGYNAAVIGAETSLAMSAVQDQLDRTTDALGENVLQLTTIDPGDSYAGKVVLAKLRDKRLPKRVRLLVSVSGETYPFEFQVAKMGTPAPIFAAVAREASPAAPPPVAPPPMPAVQTITAQAGPVATAHKVSTPALSVAPRPAVILAKQDIIAAAVPGGPSRRLANTASGYCLLVGSDYRGSGSLDRPAVTDALPRCTN
ncbi:MAG TPA: hypothetical protein VF503_12450 [Sphingobium sp.]|uniref:hypothetical protein n=1 Tax=Sphingobium sp. TaxID=1912891 RepID=UPI002ED2678A